MVQKVAKSAQRVVVMDMPPELMMPLDEGTYEFPDADIQIAIAELVE
jgi:hypothetical protein